MKHPYHTQHKIDRKIIKDIEYSIKIRQEKVSNLNAKRLDRNKEWIEERKQNKEPIIHIVYDDHIITGAELKQFMLDNNGRCKKYRNISDNKLYFRVPYSILSAYVVHNGKMIYLSKTSSFADVSCLMDSKQVMGRKYVINFYPYKKFEKQKDLDFAEERYASHLSAWEKLKTQSINVERKENNNE